MYLRRFHAETGAGLRADITSDINAPRFPKILAPTTRQTTSSRRILGNMNTQIIGSPSGGGGSREELVEAGAAAIAGQYSGMHDGIIEQDRDNAALVLAAIEPLLRQHILRVVEYLGQEPQGLPWYVTQGILGTNEAAEAWVRGMEGGSR